MRTWFWVILFAMAVVVFWCILDLEEVQEAREEDGRK